MKGIERFARQIQLAEVGQAGQQRLFRLTYRNDSSYGSDVNEFGRLYAQRCGVGAAQVHHESSAVDEKASTVQPLIAGAAQHFRHAESRAIGIGALIAQTYVVHALQLKLE